MKPLLIGLLTFLTVNLGPLAQATVVHIPRGLDPQKTNILVVLHGCLQTPESMALGTGFNEQAEEQNFVVIYPSVPKGSHPAGCWSWFKPENQRADSGQLRQIMDEVQRIKTSLGLREPKLFAAGFSAGASMVSGLLACFPHDFKGGIIHSGTAYGVVRDEAHAAMLMSNPSTRRFSLIPEGPCDPHQYSGRMLLLHGLSDDVVLPDNASMILTQFFPEARSSDRQKNYANWSSYAWRDFATDRPRVRRFKIHSLDHAWSGSSLRVILDQGVGGGPTRIPFFSSHGPSATQESWTFIREALADPTL